MASKTSRVLLLVATALLLSGCKYSFTGASVQPDVKTFSLAQFDNQASVVNPQLAQRFTELLRDRFVQQSRLRLVPREGDLQISGTIVNYDVTPLALVAGASAARNRLLIRCRVTFENIKYPDQNWDQTFENFGDFDAATPLATVERQLVEDILDKLSQDILNKALSDW